MLDGRIISFDLAQVDVHVTVRIIDSGVRNPSSVGQPWVEERCYRQGAGDRFCVFR